VPLAKRGNSLLTFAAAQLDRQHHYSHSISITQIVRAVTMVLPKATAKQQARKPNPVRPVRKTIKKATPVPPRSTARKPQPRGIPNLLDPMSDIPMPSLVSDGKALPHTSLVSDDFTVDATNYTVLFVTNTGHSGTVGSLFKCDAAGTYVAGSTMDFTIPTLQLSDAAGGPSAARAMKFSVAIVNCSNGLKRAGRVTYINSSQRLPARGPDSIGRYMPIIKGIKDSPYRRRINGDTMSVGPGQTAKHLIGYPTDSIEYANFKHFEGTESGSAFLSHVLGASEGYDPSNRPMSVIAYVFDPTTDPQDYSLTIRASYYTRWPLTSVPGQSMRNMPTSAASIINHVRDAAEDHGHELQNIVEGGLIATIGPKVGKALLTRAVGGLTTAGAGLGGLASEAGAGSSLMPLLAAL
jgi:hypothetical protein